MGRVAELRGLVEETLGSLDVSLLHAPDCVGLLGHVTAMKNMCATAEAALALRVAETGLWKREGDQSRARWLARKTGTSVPDAQRALSTSKRLQGLPETNKRAKAGGLSPSQAREIAEAAAEDPKAEDRLLDHAGSGQPLAELQRECERVKRQAHDDRRGRWERVRANRRFRFGERDGESWISGTDTPDGHAELLAVISALRDVLQAEARERGEVESLDASNADALREMARIAAAAIGLGVSATDVDEALDAIDDEPVTDEPVTDSMTSQPADGEPGPDGGCEVVPNRRARRAARFSRASWQRLRSQVKVLVRIDHDALARGFVEPGELCEIDGIGPVPVASVEALMDDAFIAALITRGHDVCTVAHLGRRPTAHQTTALEWLAPNCTNSRCPNRLWLEIDHRHDWADVAETQLENLDHLCGCCHDRKTHHGWTLDDGHGRRPLRSPDEHNNLAGPDPPTPRARQTDTAQASLDL